MENKWWKLMNDLEIAFLKQNVTPYGLLELDSDKSHLRNILENGDAVYFTFEGKWVECSTDVAQINPNYVIRIRPDWVRPEEKKVESVQTLRTQLELVRINMMALERAISEYLDSDAKALDR